MLSAEMIAREHPLFAPIAAAALLLVAIAGPGGCSARPDAPRHVVLISVDTLRRDHVSSYGYARETTPNIDAFARDAVIFETALAAHTNTAPSHASMLTGQYPPTHGIVRNGHRLGEGVRTLPQILADHGFTSAGFISGYTLRAKLTGLDRGFDFYDDRAGFSVPAETTFDRVEPWLASRDPQEERIFVFFHLFDPHAPYQAPEPFAGRFMPDGQPYRFGPKAATARVRRGQADDGEADELVTRYDDEIAYADHYVGRFLDALEQHGYWDDALVILLSDHGETLVDRAHQFDHGGRVYEEQVLVPLIVRFPGGRFGGQRIEVPAHHVDLLPTVLDSLGLAIPEETQGRSLLDAIASPRFGLGEPPERPLVSLARPVPRRVPEVRAKKVKEGLIGGLRTDRWKLIAYPTKRGQTHQLFDLDDDPMEKTDLAGARPDVVETLALVLAKWWEQTGAGEPSAPELSAEDEAALRALGYLE
jgi:arylsulfatase A-like enzyme